MAEAQAAHTAPEGYAIIDVGALAVPTIEHAVGQGQEYCTRLYADLCMISGLMDLAGNGGTPTWWRISDLAEKVANHLGLED
jgi:hypothetical protein